jgi:hypothetical protein
MTVREHDGLFAYSAELRSEVACSGNDHRAGERAQRSRKDVPGTFGQLPVVDRQYGLNSGVSQPNS